MALLVGTRDYSDPYFSSIRATHADLFAFEAVLRSPEICGFDTVQTLFDASCLEVRVAIAEMMGRASSSDLLLLYFTGHGMLDEQGRLYLCLRDTRRDVLRATGLAASSIRDDMDTSRSKRQLLILDCCHAGAFARDGKGIGVGTNVGTRASFEGTGFGRVVLTASDATQIAFEGDKVLGTSQKSLFTHYLIEGLQTGNADTDGDGMISVDELYTYVHEHVIRDAPQQTPGKWSYKQHGEMHLAKNPRPVPLPELIDRELRESIAPGKPIKIREAALREVISLSSNPRPGVALAARSLLLSLARDDSRTISALAAAALEQGSPTAQGLKASGVGHVHEAPAIHYAVNTRDAAPTFAPLSVPPKPAAAGAFGVPGPSPMGSRARRLISVSLMLCGVAAAALTHVEGGTGPDAALAPASIVADVAPPSPVAPERSTLKRERPRTNVSPSDAQASAPEKLTDAAVAPDAIVPPADHPAPRLPPSDVPFIINTSAGGSSASDERMTRKPGVSWKRPKDHVSVQLVRGELPSAVTTALRRQLAACVENGSDVGTVTFRFDIDSNGGVVNTTRHRDTPLPPATITCFAHAIKSARIEPGPAPATDVTIQVTVHPAAK